MKPIRHLAVRAPNWVGDLVLSTPILEAALAGPFERVSIVVRAHLVDVLTAGPLEPRLVPFRGSREERATLERLAPDAVLILPNSFGAAWRAFQARVPVRVGTALSARGPLLTHRFVPPTRDGRRQPVPTHHLYRDAAALLGLVPADLAPRLALSEAARADTRAALSRAGLEPDEPYGLCCPGAAFGAAKSWPARHYVTLLEALHAREGLRTVVTGGPAEAELVAALCAAAPRATLALEPGEHGLERLKAAVHGARFVVGSDSGPRHVAEAFGVPYAFVIGPNFDALTAIGLRHGQAVRVPGLECAPCLERTCPLGHHRCMEALEPEWVEAALGRARAGRGAQGSGLPGAPSLAPTRHGAAPGTAP